jgi:hypothetical protein
MELDRVNTILRRHETQQNVKTTTAEAKSDNGIIIMNNGPTKSKPKPTMADACLSARNFSENQLIALRDDVIQAKSKELELVTSANGALRTQLDALDFQVETLQETVQQKEVEVYEAHKKLDSLERAYEKLQVSAKQLQGRAFAMELSTKQNTQLLQCLQAEEAKVGPLHLSKLRMCNDMLHEFIYI